MLSTYIRTRQAVARRFGRVLSKAACYSLPPPRRLQKATTLTVSVVTATSAEPACLQTTPVLSAHHIYADLNSISPELKRSIAAEVSAAGAQFVEGAIMARVPSQGHRVPILHNGPSAQAFIDQLEPFGMRLDQIAGEIGSATAVKMCRNIVVKGMEALLFECVMAAEPYDAADRVFSSLAETFPGVHWDQLASYMVSRVVVHGERRAAEMREVARTLRGNGIEPRMAEATAELQDWAARLDLRSHFGPEGPSDYRQVLEVLKKIGAI